MLGGFGALGFGLVIPLVVVGAGWFDGLGSGWRNFSGSHYHFSWFALFLLVPTAL